MSPCSCYGSRFSPGQEGGARNPARQQIWRACAAGQGRRCLCAAGGKAANVGSCSTAAAEVSRWWRRHAGCFLASHMKDT